MNGRGTGIPTYDRALLLSGPKRNDVLDLWEVHQYGRDSFGDPDYVSLYGLKPADWYARGVRILGRTAVECTRDRLAELIASDMSAIAGTMPANSGSVVVDPFAGSGNTLYWIWRRSGAGSAVGFELDDAVFAATRRNLAIAGLDVELLHEDYETGLKAPRIQQDRLLIAFVAPPWGDALSKESGLDLRRTQPPVAGVVEFFATTFPRHPLLVGIQVHETVDRATVADVASRFDWWTAKMYEIDPPGRNHGILLGTRGWTAGRESSRRQVSESTEEED
jgi:16S rRNA G966 N2-methylase RsmD